MSDTRVTRDDLPPLQHAAHWDSLVRLSSVQRTIDQFLMARPFERGPWLAVGFGAGIVAWVVLPGPWQWAALIALCAAAVITAPLIARDGVADYLRLAIMAMATMVAAGCATIWMKSALVGTPPISAAQTVLIAGRVVDRQDHGGGVQLLLAAHIAGRAWPMLIRVMLPEPLDRPGIVIGATLAAKARLTPPPPPMLPGSHDFAFAAWFEGVGATGSISGPITVAGSTAPAPSLRRVQAGLRDHVAAHLGGSAGAIAVTLATGDRGAMGQGDADAMRDAGFAHLLAIGGLHMSAVIGLVYVLVLRGLALFPWVALRVRLPLVAALAGAAVGVGYCLITGAHVPTVRAAAVALLVLGALALGRDALSMRLLAVAALAVMLFWPEAVLEPAFQMSFGSVMAVIAVHNTAWAKRFESWRDEAWAMRVGRHAAMLLLTGLVIELALLPVALFHFHRNGLFGAVANLFAIPLVTLVAMPSLACALLLDSVGAGAPAWWLTGKALGAVLWIAHVTANAPGAVTVMPAFPGWMYGLAVAGLLWLGLWSGWVRLWGLLPLAAALAAMATVPTPDILVTGDGRHLGITGLGPDLVVLTPGPGRYARETLLEAAGMAGKTQPLEDWPGARCTHDFCALALVRGGRSTTLLIGRSTRRLNQPAVEQACAHSDIVIANRVLSPLCHPRRLLIDAAVLARNGGMTINLASGEVHTVAQTTGHHPWLPW
ncbi:ComEC/Rec2 family competence protein [Novosphingobium sp.]|uniref:ComEC/Rec2 family competence protein n=1 Tax=Novosphingobium sp. TaxID=1874826 RepID=UPI00333E6B78